MERGAEKELDRRSKFLHSLIQNKKKTNTEQHDDGDDSTSSSLNRSNVHVRACDMPLPLQNHAFQCTRQHLDSMPAKKLDSKLLALALKKVHFFFLGNFDFSKFCF